jgi:DNA-binding NtrC family response regulator
MDDNDDLEQVERNTIEKVLEKCGGCKAAAAKILGISRRTIERRVKRWLLLDQRGKKSSKNDN